MKQEVIGRRNAAVRFVLMKKIKLTTDPDNRFYLRMVIDDQKKLTHLSKTSSQ